MRIGKHNVDGFSLGVGVVALSALLCVPAVSEPLINTFTSIRNKISKRG